MCLSATFKGVLQFAILTGHVAEQIGFIILTTPDLSPVLIQLAKPVQVSTA